MLGRIRYLVFALASATIMEQATAQNLVPNPSFENNTGCPTTGGQIFLAFPWYQGNAGSADYYNICAPPDLFGVPDNKNGSQWPQSGVAYAGLLARLPNDVREYVRVPLTTALNAGAGYLVSFYVSIADDYCANAPFGALLTIDTPAYDNGQVLPYTPQIEVNGDFLGNYEDWTLVSRCFIAEGGENYITIGNFRDNSESPEDPNCGSVSYYFIDEVSVVEMPLSETSFVLDPVTACDSIEVFPGSAQAYLWGDGTTNPTLTVYESGTYHVTLSDECAFQYGEVEVTIIPTAPPVELPGDTMLCTGEELEIVLDGDAGDFLWQDDDENSTYTITQPGTYSVSLTDACETTADTIDVLFLDPPAFSLGTDTLICDGDAFTIFFDPGLGDFMWQDGSTDSSYTIDDDGTYALTISNMCGEATDAMNVEFVETLDFSIGPDQAILCAGEVIEIVLDPDLGDFLWHDGSMGSSYTVTNAGLVSVQVTNACETASDEMLVNVLLPPQFTLGPDLTVCEGQFPLTFDYSDVDDAQEWEWSDGSGQSVYQVTAPGIYMLTISNECFAEADSIEITLADDDPVVSLPADQMLCPGQTLVLDVGGLQGQYLWQDQSNADTLLVTEPGTYSLQVTNICGTGADTIVINYAAALPPPNLGADFSLCPGETAVLYAGASGVSYVWQDTSTGSVTYADSLLISGPGVFVLEVSDQCASASDTVVVTQNNNPPFVDLPESVGLCEGDTVVINSGVSGVAYLWQDGSVESHHLATLPGIYYVQVSNACGTDSDTTIVLDLGSAPIVDLGPDTGICQGDSVILDPGISGVGYLWQDGSVDARLIAHLQGTYYVQVSNQCGTASDTIVIFDLGSAPIIDLGVDTAICPGDSVILDPGLSGVEYLWQDGSVEPQNLAALPGIYYVQISNVCGSFTDTIEITVLDPIPDLDLGADQSLCPGETITIDPGILDVEYLWNDISSGSMTTETQYIASLPGMVILTISNACGSASDTIEIVLDPNGPMVDLGPDVMACEGDTVVLEAGISGVDYLWTDPTGSVSTSSTTAATVSGLYYLQVSNACGMDVDTVVVDIHGTEPTPSLGPDTILCDGEVLTLVSNADAETMIEWLNTATGGVSTGSTTAVDEPGMYVLRETNHCGFGVDTIIIDFENAPVPFDLGEDMIICPGDTVILNAPTTDALITWQDGSHDAYFIAFDEQVYTLVLSNDCGVASGEVAISFDPNEPQVILDPESLCDGESVVLDATQPFAAQYSWNTGSTAPMIQVTTPGDYFVSVITDCYFSEGTVLVSADDDCNPNIYIPNVFSPNADGINDTWEVLIDPALDISDIQCHIYDRWGNIVFGTNSLPVSWDGMFNGKEMDPGVYVYVVTLKSAEGEKDKVLYGDVTLMR